MHSGWGQMCCPICSDGKSGFHLGFKLARGYFACWRCGSLKTIDVISGFLGVSRQAAGKILGAYGGGKALRVSLEARRRSECPTPIGLGALGPLHRAFLRNRGYNLKEIVPLWELQGTGSIAAEEWRWRICFPMKNIAGEIAAWNGRHILEDAKRKYSLTKDELCAEDPKSIVYGIHKMPGRRKVIVVEGPTGVWKIGPGCGATLGINWTVEKANQLYHYKDRFILYDPEALAQAQARKLAEYLSGFPGNTELVTGFKTDPGDFTKSEVRKLRRRLLGKEA